MSIFLENEQATVNFGVQLGKACQSGALIYLDGDLGAGKTTLTRGILRAFGHHGAVKSPTFTLVEPYEFATSKVFHFVVYRLGDPEELDYLGVRDYFVPGNLCIVEWPERGGGYLPQADVTLTLEVARKGRHLRWEAHSKLGRQISDSMGST